jgi:hypothetical protein
VTSVDDEELRRVVVARLHDARNGFGGKGADGDGFGPGEDGDALNLTSLEVVRLLVRLEEDLDTEIDEAAVMNVRLDTVDDVVSLLRQSLAGAGG